MKNHPHFFVVDVFKQEQENISNLLNSAFANAEITFSKDVVFDNFNYDCIIVVVSHVDIVNKIAQLKKQLVFVPIIAFSSINDISVVVEIMKAGANEFISLQQSEKLADAIKNELRKAVLEKEQLLLELSLQNIAKALNNTDKTNFFDFCTREIQKTIQADYVLISVKNNSNSALMNVISMVDSSKILDHFYYDIKGTPCEEVIDYASSVHKSNVAEIFKDDTLLTELNIEGYIGVSLLNAHKKQMGIVAALFKTPIEQSNLKLQILQLYATFIVNELEREASEKALKTSEYNLNKAQELAKLGSWEFDLVTYDLKWSKQLFKIFDIDEKTASNELYKIYCKRLKPADLATIETFINSHQDYAFEHVIVNHSGAEKYITSIGKFFFDENGKPIKISGTAQDITERKKAEIALQRNEEKFKSLVHNISDIITLLDENGKILYQSSSIKQIMGYEENDLLGKNVFEIVHPDDRESVASIFFEAIQTEGITKSVEFRLLDKNNNYIELEAQGNNQLHNPAIQALIVNSREISHRKKIEKALLDKSKLLESIAIAGKFMFMQGDWQTVISKTLEVVGKAVDVDRIYYFENSIDEITGEETTSQQIEWTKNNISPQINNPELQKIPFDTLKDFFAQLNENKPFCTLVKDLPENSETKPLLESQDILSILVLPLFVNNRFKGFIGFDDCTHERYWSFDEISILQTLCSNLATSIEKKLVEAEIIASNERFEFVTEATSDAIWDRNLITKKTYWSNNYEKLFGYKLTHTEEDFHNFEKCIHPEDKASVFKKIDDFFKNSKEQKIAIEYRFKKSNGEYAIVKDQVIVLRDKKGKAIRVIAAMQDITQKKQEELQLKLFESAIKNSNEGILITEAEPISGKGPKIIYVNEAFTRLTGYSTAEAVGKTPRILQGPKTDKKELEKLKESLLKWQPHRFEVLNYKKTGEEFFQEISVFPIANENGWFTHWISVQKNITDRKKAEIEQQIFYDILTAINRNESIEEGLKQILEITSLHLEFAYAEAWTINIDKEKITYRTNWKATEKAGFLRGKTSITETKKGEKLVGKIWENGAVTYWNNLQESPLFSKDYALKASLTSGMGVPIFFKKEVVAVLTFFTHEPFTQKQQKASLIQKISTQIGTDIERKRTEDELNKFFSLSPDLMCIVGYDGYFKKVNKATCNILEFSEDELLNKPVDCFIHPDYLAITQENRNKLREGIALINFENVYVTKSNKSKWLAWTSIPIKEEGIIYAVAKDITEKKKMDGEKRLLIEELTRNNTELKQFSYITSHNMRAPLTNLLSIVNLLNTEHITDERTQKLIKGFKTSTYQLNDTLNDLINVLIIKERTNYELSEIDLNTTIERVIGSISSMVTKSEIELNYNFNLAETVLFSDQYLDSIFLNLITNSIKYAHPERKGVINIHSYRKNKLTHIVFNDNGIGFDMEKAKNKVFGFHQKFHNHPESKGIGLYIIHAQITALGGEISVNSKVNEGTTFTLTFKN